MPILHKNKCATLNRNIAIVMQQDWFTSLVFITAGRGSQHTLGLYYILWRWLSAPFQQKVYASGCAWTEGGKHVFLFVHMILSSLCINTVSLLTPLSKEKRGRGVRFSSHLKFTTNRVRLTAAICETLSRFTSVGCLLLDQLWSGTGLLVLFYWHWMVHFKKDQFYSPRLAF